MRPEPPLGYRVVYALDTVLNMCVGTSRVLRNGEITELPALSEVELVDFRDPPGRCESFVTDGLSTLVYTMRAKGMKDLTEKTVRYPGYVEKIRLLIDCGLFELEPVAIGGVKVVPREVLAAVLAKKLVSPDTRDLTVMRVVVRGVKSGCTASYQCDMVDFYDMDSGIQIYPSVAISRHRRDAAFFSMREM